MPELYHLSQPEVQRNYISALKDTVLLRDIIQRQNIKDAKLLEDIFVYLVNNASNLISIRNITNYFKSSGRKTSYDTIASYISYIEDTFLVHKVEKYQIKGKETIAGNCKYYINDLGFNNYLYQKRHFSTFSTTFSTAFLTIQNCKVKYHYKKQRLNIHFLYI